MIDRDVQRIETYTGIPGIYIQDFAVTESMGSITDHTLEHLAVGDRMITLTRRRLIRATRALKNKGEVPPGVDNPEVYLGACGGDFIAREGVGIDDAYAENFRTVANPTGKLQAAE